MEDRNTLLHRAQGCATFRTASALYRNISESTLSKQLKELVEDGFLERIDYGEMPPRVEYKLTAQGESFIPILLAMKQWGEEQLGL